MTDPSSQLTLLTWMSAAFPTGAFTCSHGLESAIADDRVSDEASCLDWIAGIVSQGSIWNDSLLTKAAHTTVCQQLDVAALSNSDEDKAHVDSLSKSLTELNDLALALCAGSERYRETTQLGSGFANAAAVWLSDQPSSKHLITDPLALPIALGIDTAMARIHLSDVLSAAIQSSASNLVWIATRLIPLGQTQALRIIAKLQPLVTQTATRSQGATLDDLGSSTFAAELASLEHEILRTRVCIT